LQKNCASDLFFCNVLWIYSLCYIKAAIISSVCHVQGILNEGVADMKINCLYIILRPVQEFFSTCNRRHCRWRAAKDRLMLGTQGLWAERDLYRATPVVTQDLAFTCLIRHTKNEMFLLVILDALLPRYVYIIPVYIISISPSSTSPTYVVIFQLHLHMAYIYRSLFDVQELARHTISF
jgi:hypothetical protein